MNVNLPDGLLDSVKNYLDVTWVDASTDQKLAEMIGGGMRYLNRVAGETLDYTTSGDGRTLLFEYVRYARDSAMDVFENNYQSLIVALQNDRRVSRYETDAVSTGE